MTEFIKKNKEFWSNYQAKSGGKKLLIEDSSRPMIVHANAIFSLILNQSRGYKPVWLFGGNAKQSESHSDLVKSYVENAEVLIREKLPLWLKVKIVTICFFKFLTLIKVDRILKFSYQGVKYGDLIYDSYLMRNHVATVRKIDIEIFKRMLICMARHETVKRLLNKDHYVGVMVSHQIGINSGVMLRVALRFGYAGFLRCGHHQATLQQFDKLDDVYNYEYKPTANDISKILAKVDSVEKTYRQILDFQVSGKGDKEGLDAYSKFNKYYQSKAEFNEEFKLDMQKKNIFVMMHALNDYPHSHFRWMIFKDFYDWLVKTYEFTRNNNHVNWIFKEHPSIKLYRTDDFSSRNFFVNLPEHIIYINEDKQIDTRSLQYCADLIITCIGSAGFELPALGAVPALIGGDTFYNGLGFTIEPKTKDEYFNVLKEADKIHKLTPKQQEIAQAAYIHIYHTSRVQVSACPRLNYDQEKDPKMGKWYWSKVLELYPENKQAIYQEVDEYVKKTSADNFYSLTNIESI